MKLNKYIDHTLLKQDATKNQIDCLLSEAREYDFASVCVNPTWVKSVSYTHLTLPTIYSV